MSLTALEIADALSAFFPSTAVRFRPGATNGNRALALPYVDCRAVQQRLDDVLGLDGWQDSYEVLSDGSVVCTLRCRIGEQWITRQDVGSPSEQPDEGDRRKAAFSDAVKRAAVKFGVGRYLYRLPPIWCDWDPQAKKFVKVPQLPATQAPKRPTTPAVAEAQRRSLTRGE